MKDLGFTAFLKTCLLATTQAKLGNLQRMLNGAGGYDFYKRMKLAAKDVAQGKMAPSVILSQLESIKRDSERTHNIQMANKFIEWWEKQTGAKALAACPSKISQTDSAPFGIKIYPELAYSKDNQTHVVYLWATKTPRLTRQVAAEGLLLMQKNLAVGEFKNARFHILDLRTERLHGVEIIGNNTQTLLDADVSQIAALWKSIVG